MLPIILLPAGSSCQRLPEREQESREAVLVRVNGQALTKREFELYLPEDDEYALSPAEKRQYLDRWITTQLLYDLATGEGGGVPEEVEIRLRQHKKDLVADRLVQSVIERRATVSEDEIRSYWAEHAHEYGAEFRVSHILVNSLEEAEEVRSRLAPGNFEYLARQYSIDRHSGPGGDMGYLSKGNMIPEFEEVVFGMKVGDISDIVESEFGYHIIMVTDIREAEVTLGYEDVRDEIANNLTLTKREAVYDSLVAALRSQARIELTDDAKAWLGTGLVDSVVSE